jgi:DNA integrity scanning protein DisA with diadenylate cyclase activity
MSARPAVSTISFLLSFFLFFAELDPNSHGEATFGTRHLAAASRV